MKSKRKISSRNRSLKINKSKGSVCFPCFRKILSNLSHSIDSNNIVREKSVHFRPLSSKIPTFDQNYNYNNTR